MRCFRAFCPPLSLAAVRFRLTAFVSRDQLGPAQRTVKPKASLLLVWEDMDRISEPCPLGNLKGGDRFNGNQPLDPLFAVESRFDL